MSDQEETDQPKIIVDDDWKEQVQKEKEAASKAASKDDSKPAAESAVDLGDGDSSEDDATSADASTAAEPAEATATVTADNDAGGGAAGDGAAGDGAAGDLPAASLEVHISMLFSQCLAALGQMPGPDGKPGETNKPFAKHFIDTVEMLQQKTEGNVTDDEKKMMAEVLHAMRMAYVGTK